MNYIKSKKSLIVLLLAFVLALSSCQQTPQEVESSSEDSVESESSVEEKVELTVVDQAGREVSLDKPAQKIISAYFIPSYTLMSLGLQDKVVGIENKPESRPFYEKFGKDMDKQPQVGTRKELNLEEIISLEPDLVILPDGQIDAANQLAEIGIKSIIVNPENEETYTEMLDIIGVLTATEDRVEVLKSFFKEKTQLLETILKETLENSDIKTKTAYLSSASSPLRGASKDMFQSNILSRSKIESVTSEVEGDHWADFSLEQIVAYNPEMIFIAAQPDFEISEMLDDEKWKDIDGVKNQNIFIIPSNIDNWDTPSYASVLASYWMVSKAYPEIISPEEVIQVSKEYYQLFFGYEITEEELGL